MTYAQTAKTFQFSLSRRGKHKCPACGRKEFVRYVDKTTNEYIPEQYGRCDRVDHCAYYLNPYKDGWVKSQGQSLTQTMGYITPVAIPERTFIPGDILQATIDNGFEQNTFIQNLSTSIPFPFDPSDVQAVCDLYKLGTVAAGRFKGALTIPFIDENSNTRTIQVKQFDQENHTTGTNFLHSIIRFHYERKAEAPPEWLDKYLNNDGFVTCLFGTHLLTKYPRNRIALVEAPKTAIYGTLYFGLPQTDDDLLWLAVFNRSSLKLSRCRVLKGRTVYLFPDLSHDGGCFREWKEKADELAGQIPGVKMITSDLLEKIATDQEREKGADLADVIGRMDWREFRGALRSIAKPVPKVEPDPVREEEVIIPPPVVVYNESTYVELQPAFTVPGEWDREIKQIDDWLQSAQLPEGRIEVGLIKTDNVKLFIHNHLETAKANNGNPYFRSYLDRLKAMIGHLQSA